MIAWAIGKLWPPDAKALGSLEAGTVQTCIRYAQRKVEADAMPQLIQYNFVAASWILAKRPKPQVGISRLGGA